MTVPAVRTAYEDPATRWAWRRAASFRLGVVLLSLASFVAWLYAVVLTPVWTLWIWMPVLFVLIHIALQALVLVLTVNRLRRVLKVYPWQSCPGAASIAKNGTTRFTLADPEAPDRRITLKWGDWLGSGVTFWVREVKAGGVGEIWFAGDPRFLGVVAAPGPRRLLSVAQKEAVDDRTAARRRGVSPEARERARAAGARVG
ncbi:hypothetical protein [Streptomyces griseoviridis]|uniref:Uncharacterized protein n=1 Tax=Streptomyces griseoviridis TaxID=45398 RepID=A0ABT9LLK4_STRGD|nr:hypothetical protein [Streptomyces griseoviridis]MDP9684430.1 hypothetical protein [Streptomyces griseoviridis]GGT22700.1 hypothetical protein GCM10010240_64300 [Streptomyces griseoviridis]